MKKTLSLLILTLIAGMANAQNAKFGVRLRYTSAKINTTQGNLSASSFALKNVDAGVFAEIDYGQISFQPGLSIIMKGGVGGGGYIYTATTFSTVASTLSFNSLELPLNVTYNIKLKPGRIFLGGGPYVGYNLSGKAEFDIFNYNASGALVSKDNSHQKVSFTSDPNDFKRFEVGLNALAGFRLNNGLEINFGLGAGLTSITNDPNTKITNSTLSAGLGYLF